MIRILFSNSLLTLYNVLLTWQGQRNSWVVLRIKSAYKIKRDWRGLWLAKWIFVRSAVWKLRNSLSKGAVCAAAPISMMHPHSQMCRKTFLTKSNSKIRFMVSFQIIADTLLIRVSYDVPDAIRILIEKPFHCFVCWWFCNAIVYALHSLINVPGLFSVKNLTFCNVILCFWPIKSLIFNRHPTPIY